MRNLNLKLLLDLKFGDQKLFDVFKTWTSMKAVFLSELAEKNLRFLIADVFMLHQIYINTSHFTNSSLFYFQRPGPGISSTWTRDEIFEHLRMSIEAEARLINNER